MSATRAQPHGVSKGTLLPPLVGFVGRIARSRTPPLHLVPPHPHSVEDTTTSTKSPSDSTATHNPKKHLFGPALMGWSAQGAPGLTTDFYQTEKALMTPSLPWRINGKLGLVRERYPEGVFYGSAKHTSGPGITMHIAAGCLNHSHWQANANATNEHTIRDLQHLRGFR